MYFISISLFLYQCIRCNGSNWAQVSGNIAQTVTFPQVPTPQAPHWDGRYGMSSVIYPPSGSLQDGGNNGTVFMLGGDTYDGIARAKQGGGFDTEWSRGFKNDVWKMGGTEWLVSGNYELREQHYGRKIPKVQSQLRWERVTQGVVPPPEMTYDSWIICEPYFQGLKYQAERLARDCPDIQHQNATYQTQWSPRRHHASVYFKGYLWVLGGRAREFVPLSEDRSVGGIMGPRISDVRNTAGENLQRFTTTRETIVVKSDVWRSRDGRLWELVTPGCHAPQKELIPGGNSRDGKFGVYGAQCTSSSDCYGAEDCNLELGTCECKMWSSREQHAVTVNGDKMYISGGYASALFSKKNNCGAYACGDTDASSTRYFLNDVWVSSDGLNWDIQTPAAAFPGRGGHQMLIVPFYGVPTLWIVGGRGGNNTGTNDVHFFNDIWVATLDRPELWVPLEQYMVSISVATAPALTWSPRTGHTVTLMEASPGNRFGKTIFIIGGYNDDEGFIDDVWSWRPENPDDFWRRDYTNEALFGYGMDSSFTMDINGPAPNYIYPDAPLELMQKWWVPDRIKVSEGLPSSKRDWVTEKDLAQFHSLGIYTVRDLAEADKYKILKLRGYDVPQVPMSDRLDMYDVCDKRELAIAIVDKCSADPLAEKFAAENRYPKKLTPTFGGGAPGYTPHKWYGNPWAEFDPLPTDDVVITDEWDGCNLIAHMSMTGHLSPNVNGLGNVDQIEAIRDPLPELQEYTCRQSPGRRAWHNALAFEERLYVFGGKDGDTVYHADTWYRDSLMPVARMTGKPKTQSSQAWFTFASNKPGCIFEMRVWNPVDYKEIRPWVPVAKRLPIGFLQWQLGGPGNGLYTVYVRAVDPAGNKDYLYIPKNNVHQWFYISPTPWPIIGACIGSLLGVALIGYLEYRRRVKKAAMERYAMKRMRRKFKAMQRELDGRGVDWRTLYNESKNAPNKKDDKRAKKKKRDGKKEARDAEKKKREKEKERIKKKLKASKEFKDKKKTKEVDDEEEEEDVGEEATPVTGTKKEHEKRIKGKARGGGNIIEFDDSTPAKGEKKKYKPEELEDKGGKKYKEEELKGKKFKAEEVAGGLGNSGGPLEEGGAKQRKTNKKLKDYEVAGGMGDGKKDA